MVSLVALALSLAALAPSELEQRGQDHLYNMEFEEAREIFGELTRRAPRSPVGPYYEATTLWMQEFARRGGMAGATFRNRQYWTRTDHSPPPPELARDIEALVAESVERSQAILQASPEDSEALFFRGAIEGVRSAYHASIERSYYEAYRAGKRAKEFHERLLELDPDYGDAYLLPGVYEYTVATLPRSLRILGFVFGLRGSREKGLSLVERAVEQGDRTRWVARLSFSVMQQREKKYRAAAAILRELERAFPRNPLLPFERGSVYLLRKDWRSARRVFRHILARQKAGAPNFDRVEPSLVLLKLGESFLFAKDYDRARAQFERALRIPDVPAWIRTSIYLRRGMASDARGARRAAVSDYRRCRRLDVDEQTSALAERYLDRPYR